MELRIARVNSDVFLVVDSSLATVARVVWAPDRVDYELTFVAPSIPARLVSDILNLIDEEDVEQSADLCTDDPLDEDDPYTCMWCDHRG